MYLIAKKKKMYKFIIFFLAFLNLSGDADTFQVPFVQPMYTFVLSPPYDAIPGRGVWLSAQLADRFACIPSQFALEAISAMIFSATSLQMPELLSGSHVDAKPCVSLSAAHTYPWSPRSVVTHVNAGIPPFLLVCIQFVYLPVPHSFRCNSEFCQLCQYLLIGAASVHTLYRAQVYILAYGIPVAFVQAFGKVNLTYHVLPAMIRKIYLAKCLNEGNWDAVRKDIDLRPVEGVNGSCTDEEILAKLAKFGITPEAVTLWGTGKPLREFLWSEEMADASVHVLLNVDFKDTYAAGSKEIRNCHINVGTGKELSIREVAEKIMAEIGFKGELRWDASKPDGTLRKLTDVTKLHNLGWHHKVEIDEGIHRLYEWYLKGICINHRTD